MKLMISVVIATYKRPNLLKRCITALVNQSLLHELYEIIVVTDGPDEKTVECLTILSQQFYQMPKLRMASLLHKGGPAAARNLGWKIAKGKLVVFTDDDCIPLHSFLDAYRNAFLKSGQDFIAFSGKIKVPVMSIPTDYEKNIAQLETAEFVTANCACTRKSLEIIGGLDESFKMAWREDTALEYSLREHYIPIVKAENAMVVHPARTARWGVSIKAEKKNMFNTLLYKTHPILYERNIGVCTPRLYYVAVLLFTLSVLSLMLSASLAAIFFFYWLFTTFWFAFTRLQGTSKKTAHVFEMIFTSAVIPFVSVFWSIYGAIHFKSKIV